MLLAGALLALLVAVLAALPANPASLAGRVYTTPVTAEQLKTGLVLDAGAANVFYWPRELTGDTKIADVVKDIQSAVYYVYNYNDRTYWFNPNEKYKQYAANPLYRNKLTDVFKPGHRYRVYMKNSAVLKYESVLSCDNATETDGGRQANIFGERVKFDTPRAGEPCWPKTSVLTVQS